MTEEQKRFKIQRRISYEEQLSKESKNAIETTFLLGFVTAGAVCAFSSSFNTNNDDLIRLMNLILGVIDTGLAAYNLKCLMEAISRKTMLQGKIEDINAELEMFKNEQKRGMWR